MEDVVQQLACVVAMPADRSLASGDHAVIVDSIPTAPPLLTVLGGTLTTHRRIAEEVVDRLARFRKVLPPWTAEASLPGGNFPPEQGAAHLCLALRAAYPFISEDYAHRLVTTYGTRASTHPHRRPRIRRSRSLLRRRPDGGGGRLSPPRRMGDDGGGRAVAAHAPRASISRKAQADALAAWMGEAVPAER